MKSKKLAEWKIFLNLQCAAILAASKHVSLLTFNVHSMDEDDKLGCNIIISSCRGKEKNSNFEIKERNEKL